MSAAADLLEQALARPRVRINQLGYLAHGPKQATLITEAHAPLRFWIVDADGSTVFDGTSARHQDDAVFSTHTIDFSDHQSVGTAYVVWCGDAFSRPFAIADDLYADLRRDALRFFYPQRSGIAICDDRAPAYGRPAGHLGVAPNRGDTAVARWRGAAADALYPGWRFDREVDVSGGWYDAGDHGKYVVCGGLSAGMLLAAYEHVIRVGGPTEHADALLDEAMWEVDWMLRMQVPAGEQHAGLAFHRVHDDHWTPLPLSPQDDPALRVLHRPSTAAGLNLAAVAAHAARCFPQRADQLLEVACTAYDAALREPALYAPQDHGAHGGGPYDDDDVNDERYWAATELYLTTGTERYRVDLLESPCHHDDVFDPAGFDWDTVAPFARVQLALAAPDLADVERVRQSVVRAADRLIGLQARQAWGQPHGPEGGWDRGSNGRILSNLVVIGTASLIDDASRYARGFVSGLDYLLGRNPVGLSFITGYGTDFSHRQRSRHFGHALDPAFPPPPRGAVAGGPASKTYEGFPGDPRFATLPDQLCYVDEPTSETTNDVCIRWNAALLLALTFTLSGTLPGTSPAGPAVPPGST